MTTQKAAPTAERIRAIRVARALTQEALAELAGLSRDALSRIERGDRTARVATLQQLADALKVPLSALLTEGDPPEDEPDSAPIDELRLLLGRLSSAEAKSVLRVVRVLVRELGSLRPRTRHAQARLGRRSER